MSGTIKSGSHDINGVPKDYYFPDPVGDITENSTDQEVNGVPASYFEAPAPGSIQKVEHKVNGVTKCYWVPETTGFGSEGGGRYFTTLDAAGSQYYTIPDFSLAVGDILEFKYTAPTSITTATEYFCDNSTGGGTRAFLNMQNTGIFASQGWSTLEVDGISVGLTSTYPVDGKIHTIRLTSNSATRFVGRIAASFIGGNTINSVMYDFKITRGSTVERFYKLDEDWVGPSTVVVDSGSDKLNGTTVNITSTDAEEFQREGDDWLGEELIENTDFNDASWWSTGTYTTIQNGRAEFDDTASPGDLDNFISRSTLLVSGYTYKNVIEISGLSSGGANFTAFGSAFPNNIITANGEFEVIGSATTTLQRVRRSDSGGTNIFNIDRISTKRILEAP